MSFGFLKKLLKKDAFDEDNETIVVSESYSSHSEGYNRLKDNLLYLNADGTKKVIQIESSVASEGKTTITANLAVSLGLTDKKVIVIDLDFRKPKMHKKFNISREKGLTDFMRGELTKEEIIKKTKYKNVEVITRGSNAYNSSVILTSGKFKSLIKELRDSYDYVLVDCAPVLQVSDFIHISQVSDGVIFLVAYGSTTKSQVGEAIKELKKNGANILGTVFSMYDRKKDKYGDGYYYYNKKYNYYRDTEEDKKKKSKKVND